MSSAAALALYPLLAVALAVGFTAARIARRAGRGLVLVCLLLGGWTAALILLEHTAVPWAERVVPAGMLLAGAFVQAAAEISGWRRPRVVWATWCASGAVALAGLLAPRLIFGPGARGAGPLFAPLAAASVLGTLAVKVHLALLVREAPDRHERRRRAALLAANAFGALGGGAAITLRITGLAPAGAGAPFLIVSVFMAAYAVGSGEFGRDQALWREALASAAVGAALSLAVFAALALGLPVLAPAARAGRPTFWALFVAACVLVPVDPLRLLVVERLLSRAFRRPVGVRALAAEADAARERAAQAQRLAEIGQLASAVAHEVRNPLGVILAELKLLERAGADAEGLEAVRGQVRRASRFVDDLLRYARPRALDVARVDLHAVAREAARQAARALGPGERPEVALPAGEGPAVEGDAAALTDLLTNLVTNALIAAEARPGARVRVAVERAGAARVRVAVEDDGPGVPPELEPRLFQAFSTGRARDARRPGTGLGLAICRALAEAHGGTIAHERPAGGGARFVVLLPRVAAAR